jgi:hypothetical protein
MRLAQFVKQQVSHQQHFSELLQRQTIQASYSLEERVPSKNYLLQSLLA